jgi:hypothetical protein
MRVPKSRSLVVGLAVGALTVAGALPAGAGSSAPNHQPGTPAVIASGLNNPRQLAFAANGDLYVAEAGSGGAGPCAGGPEGGNVCFGTSGSVTKISARSGKQTRVLTGLPSIASEGDGGQAAGPSDVLPIGGDIIAVLIGMGGNLDTRAMLGAAGSSMGTLQLANTHSGRTWQIADLVAYEDKTNPIDDVDSNPVGLSAGHGRLVVADAGGNTAVSVGPGRRLSTLAVLPDLTNPTPIGGPTVQGVATSTAWGPDGALYISQLTGFPFVAGLASIYRVGRDGSMSVFASGLTNVTDLAFRGRDLYAVQIASNGLLNGPVGSLVRVDRGSTQPTVVAGGLFAPYGLAIRGANAYLTTGSVAAGAGQVLRIPLS